MYKHFILIILFFTSFSLFAQNKDSLITDKSSGKPMLIGECTRDALQDTTFSWWFNSTYELYDVDSTALPEIKNLMKNVRVTIVMGTWCSDSQRQVPRFYKIMDAINEPADSISLICVDRDKKDISGEVDSLYVNLVPTFIFYKNNEELGRIIEAPQWSLEEDMLRILNGKEKSHSD